MEQLPTTAGMQEVEQRMEQLPRVSVGLAIGIGRKRLERGRIFPSCGSVQQDSCGNQDG